MCLCVSLEFTNTSIRLVGLVGVLRSLELDLQTLHADLKTIHGLNSRLSRLRIVVADESEAFALIGRSVHIDLKSNKYNLKLKVITYGHAKLPFVAF
jgi:hypothetical protein